MSQQEINQNEWNDSNNWSSPKWLGLYFSKKDSRWVVPKPYPALGWTLNLARRKGCGAFFTLVFFGLAIVFSIGYVL